MADMETFLKDELLNACQYGTWLEVWTWLQLGAQVSWTYDGHGALHYASLGNNMEVAENLLAGDADRRGMDPSLRTEGQDTPLHVACSEGHAEMVGLLIKHGADVAAVNRGKNTLLHVAAMEGHEAIVKRLVTCPGVSINAKNCLGCYAFLFGVLSFANRSGQNTPR
ncbi:hypothetical protein ACOMHN_046849 [Nucella lapillus]